MRPGKRKNRGKKISTGKKLQCDQYVCKKHTLRVKQYDTAKTVYILKQKDRRFCSRRIKLVAEESTSKVQ